jgi:hypothetical protein
MSMPEDTVNQDQLVAAITELEDTVKSLTKERDALSSKVSALEGKLRANKSAPTGDVVYLGGVSYPVVTTVRANPTFDEVKKGVILEGVTLVAIDRTH